MSAFFTLFASGAAWLAFDQVGDAQQRVNEDSVPQLAASFSVAQQASALAASAPRLLFAGGAEGLAEIERELNEQRLRFETALLALTSRSGDRFDRVRDRGGVLITNIEALIRSTRQEFAFEEQASSMNARLTSLENDFHELLDGFRAGFREDVDAALFQLTGALSTSNEEALNQSRRTFDNRLESIMRESARLSPNSSARRRLSRAVNRLSEIGGAQGGVFELRAAQIELNERQQTLLAENFQLAEGLLGEIEGLVDGARLGASSATVASEEAITLGRLLLILINSVSIIGALLIAWLLVGRLLLPRLQYLSDRMRAMANGDLEAEVDIGGRDEVADMAAALEVFRRHALEVQRLNLVEELAKELGTKNTQLESTLEELRHMQNQIVAREKLASLGELTAGVAHEIRNPLNFVKNFAEACEDLLADMKEDMETGEVKLDDRQQSFLEEYHTILGQNLSRIRSHGDRADRIVGDMLKLGGSGGERRLLDINDFLDHQVKSTLEGLHSAEPHVNLMIERNFDPDVGHVEVVPQDMSRVLHNLVVNAYQAIEERLQLAEDTFEPRLLLTTQREEDRVEVRIKDNGMGIKEENLDKIFDPFFTTKPTDQGTGLGLSLCGDIMRGHGGSVRVESVYGEGAEIILEFPTTSTSPEE